MASGIVAPRVIFEGDGFLVINKPSGLVVDRSDSCKFKTLQDWLEEKGFFDFSGREESDFFKRSGVVHRLDKDTSGLLVVAKDEPSFIFLQAQFKQRLVEKKYLALVHGLVKPEKGTIKLPIGRNPFNRKKFGVFFNGRKSETSYYLVKKYQKKNSLVFDFSLLKLSPKTGRTHQLRVHLKEIGYPIVADPVYGGRKNNSFDRAWCPRLFLHAGFLSFFHPKNKKKRVSFNSSLAKDLAEALKKLT